MATGGGADESVSSHQREEGNMAKDTDWQTAVKEELTKAAKKDMMPQETRRFEEKIAAIKRLGEGLN